jgi:hypothetical protein
MSVSISSLVQRCSRQMPKFFGADACSASNFITEEVPLGLYRNQDSDDVVFTSLGLRCGKRPLISYQLIADARVIGDKQAASQIELSLTTGESERVTFDGGNERFRDVWEILRLLDRIRSVADR